MLFTTHLFGTSGAGTSPPRGEVGAERRVRGQRGYCHHNPLTLTLSPEGRGDPRRFPSDFHKLIKIL
jgi:hypothetical protein